MPYRSYKEFTEQTRKIFFNHLTVRERTVLNLRYGLEDGHLRTFTQIGQEIGRSRWTASRIHGTVLDKLRHPIARMELVGVLDQT